MPHADRGKVVAATVDRIITKDHADNPSQFAPIRGLDGAAKA